MESVKQVRQEFCALVAAQSRKEYDRCKDCPYADNPTDERCNACSK